jgi:hypothetical protein
MGKGKWIFAKAHCHSPTPQQEENLHGDFEMNAIRQIIEDLCINQKIVSRVSKTLASIKKKIDFL